MSAYLERTRRMPLSIPNVSQFMRAYEHMSPHMVMAYAVLGLHFILFIVNFVGSPTPRLLIGVL